LISQQIGRLSFAEPVISSEAVYSFKEAHSGTKHRKNSVLGKKEKKKIQNGKGSPGLRFDWKKKVLRKGCDVRLFKKTVGNVFWVDLQKYFQAKFKKNNILEKLQLWGMWVNTYFDKKLEMS